ncbi:hypothetical protein SAMN02910369_02875 [Lachnospiraceae bacterium NE2001]|nr:hypothetical protein SAMN02910369_02875 [Lachnospiraceae bacterium NE2001]
MYNSDILFKTGRDLLSDDIIEYFEGVRSVDYRNVLDKRQLEYTWAEWLVCLHEKVLLEQCLPFVTERLNADPLIPGYFSKGEVLYEVSVIDRDFWLNHKEWYDYYSTIISSVLNMSEMDLEEIESKHRPVYIEAYQKFLKLNIE